MYEFREEGKEKNYGEIGEGRKKMEASQTRPFSSRPEWELGTAR
jgi:hypothetical protein